MNCLKRHLWWQNFQITVEKIIMRMIRWKPSSMSSEGDVLHSMVRKHQINMRKNATLFKKYIYIYLKGFARGSPGSVLLVLYKI
jgi:hypothetical protein